MSHLLDQAQPRAAMGWTSAAIGVFLFACSPSQTALKADPNVARTRLVQAIASRPSDAPIQLRYNPAACNCPAFEARLAKRWVRAQWLNAAAPEFAKKMAKLRASTPEQWPIAMLVQGQFEGEIMRTEQGQHGLQIEVKEIVGDGGAAPTAGEFEIAPGHPVPIPTPAVVPTVQAPSK